MNLPRFFLLLALVLGMSYSSWAAEKAQAVSLCSIQKNPERFLHEGVEVRAVIFAGLEIDQLQEGRCLFRVAYGDDYQTFGDRFHVNHNAQWDLMRKLLKTPNNCSGKARFIKAKIRGSVEHVPAIVGIPENEMPFELVIQSVSEVEQAPVVCTPPTTPSADTLLHESGHDVVDPQSQY